MTASIVRVDFNAGSGHRRSGAVLRPNVDQPPPTDCTADWAADRAAECARLGLDPSRPVGIVRFGGQGGMTMLTIARQLQDVQLVHLCGHNTLLAERLRALQPSAVHAVVGFTPDEQRDLALGDFFIGRPGPGSLSEALHLGLPVVTVRNAWTMPQERDNTDWVQAMGVGVVGTSWRRLRPLVDQVVAELPRHRAAVRRLRNRAEFEVPEVLAGLLAQAQEQARARPGPALAGAESTRHLASPREPSTCPIG